ncbi:amidase [Facklamia hominis]|uniref:Amidase domain-containing protein n=1 Tax=Facklamia hominis CCUG 36813 TaxID=883111 RepID=K1LIU3_9LACT|nr:amidase [Facklamia hominis]EKB54571.1 hypothetical protein HMPREF9706_00761 [Facklamia hominis CCUG 36813]EPH11990.1 hypothetical protein HMPREF9260_00752 [Facklamia hominis ACS-120-V-Sch10]
MLFTEDAVQIAQQIRQSNISIVDTVQRALNNINRYNPLLNAVTHIQFDALNVAEAYQAKLEALSDAQKETLPPFYGVPILLKDLGQTQAGQPSTSGSRLMKNFIAPITDNFVQQILDAGFIVVGRTNTPEFGFKNESDSDFNGAVNHPMDLKRNPGGSSGGAAAALKAGLVPAVTASDGGGSIRIPASFTGLIGLKPTRGRMPVGPGGYRGWQGASINFAITRTVRDTWEMLKALQVEQTEAAFFCPKISQQDLIELDRPLKIAYTYDVPAGYTLRKDAREALDQAIEQLKQLGHQLVEVPLPTDGRKAMETYYMVNGVETQVMMESIEQGQQRTVTQDDMEPMSWALYRSGENVTGADYSRVLTYWDNLAVQMEQFFQEYDVLLTPTNNGAAFVHEEFHQQPEMIDRLHHIDDLSKSEQQSLIWEVFNHSLEWTPFTQQQNLAGQPAISLPMYHTAQGLPIGIQAWGGRGEEYLLLQLALQLEENGLLYTDIIDLSTQINE